MLLQSSPGAIAAPTFLSAPGTPLNTNALIFGHVIPTVGYYYYMRRNNKNGVLMTPISRRSRINHHRIGKKLMNNKSVVKWHFVRETLQNKILIKKNKFSSTIDNLLDKACLIIKKKLRVLVAKETCYAARAISLIKKSQSKRVKGQTLKTQRTALNREWNSFSSMASISLYGNSLAKKKELNSR